MRLQSAYDLVTVHDFILPLPFLTVKAREFNRLVNSKIRGNLMECNQFDGTDFHAEPFSGNNSIQAVFLSMIQQRCNITESSR